MQEFRFMNKTFIYDKEKSIIYYVTPVTAEIDREIDEWANIYDEPLYKLLIVRDMKYLLLNSSEVSNEVWYDLSARQLYLLDWLAEIDMETQYMNM